VAVAVVAAVGRDDFDRWSRLRWWSRYGEALERVAKLRVAFRRFD